MSTDPMNPPTDRERPALSEALAPCPFCNGTAIFSENQIDFEPVWGVRCDDECGAWIDSCSVDKAEAAEIWNTRASPKPPLTQGGVVELVEGLKPLADRFAAKGWGGIESTLFRVSEDEATAFVKLLNTAERLAGERGGDLTDVFGRPFDGDDDPRLKVAEVITRAEADAILEYRGDLVGVLAPQPLPVEVEREGNQDLTASQTSPVGHGALPMPPEGWRLVPIAPDLGMLHAALQMNRSLEEPRALHVGTEYHSADIIYRAMINAAPPPESRADDQASTPDRRRLRDAPLNPKAPDHG